MNAAKTIALRAFNRAGMWFLIVVSVFVVMSHMQPEKQSFEPKPVKHTPAWTTAKHDAECWVFATEAKPANVDDMTGSVIVQFHGERDSGTYRVSDPEIHHRAWTEMLDKSVNDEGITVLGICL
jgi:hypothetical protein